MTLKIIFLLFLLTLSLARTYPSYKQCDSKWMSVPLGFSNQTICKAGAQITCVAMALDAVAQTFTPATINTWLQQRNGFKGTSIIWDAVNPLGL